MKKGKGASGKLEEWRWVVGEAGRYSVSSLGNVRSHFFLTPRLLAQSVDRYGYLRVNLSGKHRKVHRLVCEAFQKPCAQPSPPDLRRDG